MKDREFLEEKGCITSSEICVNLGKKANMETGREKYYCVRGFPDDCSRYGCPKLMPMSSPEHWRLKTLSKRKLKMLRSVVADLRKARQVKRLTRWRRRAGVPTI